MSGVVRVGKALGRLTRPAACLLCVLAALPAAAQSQSLELIGSLELSAHIVELQGETAYVAADETFRIVDLSTPERPVARGTLSAPGRIWGIHVAEPYVYLAGGLEGLHIVDVSDPSAPRLVSTHPTAGQTLAATTAGATALVVNLMTGLEIVDISDHAAPTLLSTHETAGYQWGVSANETTAFVVDQPSGLVLFDISDPTTPIEIGAHQTAEPAQSVELGGGGRAYLLAPRAGLIEIVDIGDPAAPSHAGSYSPNGGFQNVAIRDYELLVPVGDGGIEIVDVADPTAPTPRGTHDTPGHARDVAVRDTLVVVADTDSLSVFRLR